MIMKNEIGMFILGGLFFVCLIMAILPSIDRNADQTKKQIAYGESVCEKFGGLKSYDSWNNYTCNNNLVITGDNHE
jgi:hypothetical protein